MNIEKYIKPILDYVEEKKLYPELKIINDGAKPEVIIDGEKILMFSSNNYLGLSYHPDVIKAAVNATKMYGVGSGGSRMLSGNLKIHRDYERAIAQFKGGEDAIVWTTGYQANLGVITAIMDPPKILFKDFIRKKSVIFSDELNHASIIDGAKMSRQKVVVYKHKDTRDLESKLRKYKRYKKIVVTDSVFSMEGDIAPLPTIVKLTKKYDSILMIDEAHATGVLGQTGEGSLEHFNLKVTKDVDIVFGTHSKALGAAGGFVVGSKKLIDYLRITSRSYIFSAAMPPSVSASLIVALEIIKKEPKRLQRLNTNVNYLKKGLQQHGFDTLGSETQIVPVLIGEDKKAIEFSNLLFDKHIYAPCVRWPAVPKNQARLRLTVMAQHKDEQIRYLIKSCKKIAYKLKIL